MNDPFIGEIASEIVELFRAHGEPSGGHTARWELNSPVFCRASPKDMGDWQGWEEEAARAFNAAIVSLYEMLDYRHVGGDMWTCGYDVSDAWRAFRDAATDMIDDWVASRAFELFCDDPYEIVG